MNNLLSIEYSNIGKKQELDKLIKEKFAALLKKYNSIQFCRISVAHLRQFLSKGDNCYKVSINLKLAPNLNFFVVRDPDYARQIESPEFVIDNAFSMIEQQLEETQNHPTNK